MVGSIKIKSITIVVLMSFLIMTAALSIIDSFVFLELSLEVKGPVNDAFQVYYDVGQDYNESHSVNSFKSSQSKAGDFAKFVFKLPVKKIKKIRIDPGSKNGTIIIKDICLKSLIDEHCWAASDIYREFKPLNDIAIFTVKENLLHIESSGHDPFFEYNSRLSKVLNYNSKIGITKAFLFFVSLLLSIVLFPNISIIKSFFVNAIKNMKNAVTDAKVENIYFFIGTIYGLLFLIIMPPFQVPDEYMHFYRAYHVSEGKILSTIRDNTIGDFLPKSLVITSQNVSKGLPFHPENKQEIKDIIAMFSLPLNDKDRVFFNFNSALYFPTVYLPQAFGIRFGRMLNSSPIEIMYWGRIFNLTISVVLIYFAIRIIPISKWLFFLLALTPMFVSQASSLSADGFINAFAFLFIAIIIRYSFLLRELARSEILLLFLFAILLSLSKQAYSPLIFITLLMPMERFGSKKKYFITISLLFLVSMIVSAVWSLAISDMAEVFIKNISQFFKVELLSPGKKILYILNEPLVYCGIILSTLKLYGLAYAVQFIGVLGWLDTPLPIWLVYSYWIMLFITTLVTIQDNITLNYKVKVVMFISLFFCVMLVFTSQYILGAPIVANAIGGIHGRYFIPMSPLLFLLFYNQRVKLNSDWFKLLIVCYALFSLTFALFIVFKRYYL